MWSCLINLSICTICFSRSGDLDPRVGALYIAVRRPLSVRSGTGFPSDHPIVHLLEGDGTKREEVYGSEKHVPDTDWGLGPGCGYLHEYQRDPQEIVSRKEVKVKK